MMEIIGEIQNSHLFEKCKHVPLSSYVIKVVEEKNKSLSIKGLKKNRNHYTCIYMQKGKKKCIPFIIVICKNIPSCCIDNIERYKILFMNTQYLYQSNYVSTIYFTIGLD